MLRLQGFKHLVLVILFVIAAGCSGGGCSSGCSCGGVSPLAEGFKPAQRIENAASIRLTSSGIGFLEANMAMLATNLLGSNGKNGVLTFEIPKSSGDIPLIDKFDVCPGGPKPMANPPECVAEIDLGNSKLKLDPVAPHNLKITGPLPLRLRKLPLEVTYFCLPIVGCAKSKVRVTLTGNKHCDDDPPQDYLDLNLNVNVEIAIDQNQQHSRYGYSRVKVDVGFDENQLKSSLKICGSFDAQIFQGLLGLAGNLIISPLKSTLKSQIDKQLCQKANKMLNPPCPAGTQDVGGVCRYGNNDSAECASIVLGTEGHIDLGGFLQGISAGATGAFDFLLAAGGHNKRTDNTGEHWGDLNPIGKGITLGMYGGTEPAPVSNCVPRVQSTLPTGIPIPDELLANTLGDWPMMKAGPHFGLALSQRFANYALEQVYNSGALCLGITGDALGTPITSTLLATGLNAKSLAELGRMKKGASMAFLLRPQKPPTIAFGNGTDLEKDPLLDIKLSGLAIDFYVWSLDRYIRAMTVTTDIQAPMNLTVTPDGLTPVLKTLKLSNTAVSNHEQLLRDDPKAIATALEGLVGSLLGGALGGAFKPIDVNKQFGGFGLKLEIPETVDGKGTPGLRKLTKGTDNFLGIFAALGLASMPPKMMSETSAKLVGFDVDNKGIHLATWTPENGPRARIRLGATVHREGAAPAHDDGSVEIEWQYKVDNNLWRPFTRARDLEIDDPALRNQGVHKVWIRSRVVGDPSSLDPEPQLIELRVDDTPPHIQIRKEPTGRVRIEAHDLVSAETVQVRVRFGFGPSEDDGDWGEWSAWQPLAEVATLDYGQASLIQVEAKDEAENVGQVTQAIIRGQGTGGSGCQCTLEPGATSDLRGSWGWLLGIALCGGLAARRARRARALAAAAGFVLLAGAAPGCSCNEAQVIGEANDCRSKGTCTVIMPGLIGAYSSAVAAPDGTMWVAGYLEANWDPEANWSFGDLVVGRADGKGQVQWKVVDGTSAEETVDPNVYDPKGFRDGKTESGDDVGMWTSIALASDGQPAVAYYDDTNRALKYAHASADGSWKITTVKSGAKGTSYGTYAKLAFVGGKPNIAFHFAEPSPMGFVSGVRLAIGADADGSSWAFEDVVADNTTPCNATSCSSDQLCLVTGQCIAKKDGCMMCGSGKECVDDGKGGASCEKVKASGAPVTYPNEVGLYVAIATGSDGALRIAYYDRPKGNVLVAAKNGGEWKSVLVDGSDGKNDTGDKGIGLSLAIDGGGNYHLAYVDGLKEALAYAMVQGGTTPLPAELVDDGLGANEGHHVIGDDANVFVTQGGEVRISYQNATTGKLQLAVGTANGNKHEWKVQTITQDGFAGFFSRQLTVGNDYKIINWWRVGGPLPKGDVRIVTPM